MSLPDGQRLIDVELVNMPALSLEREAGEPTAHLVTIIQQWLGAQRQAQHAARGEYVREHVSRSERLTAEECEDLERRLLAATDAAPLQIRPPGALVGVRPALIIGEEPGTARPIWEPGNRSVAPALAAAIADGHELVCGEWRRLLDDAAERAARLRAQFPEGLPDATGERKAPAWVNDLLERVATRAIAPAELEDLPSGWADPVLAYRLHLALVWPEVDRQWRTEHAARLGARAALRHHAADPLTLEPVAEGRLEQAVREWLAAAQKGLTVPPGRDELQALGERNGMFALDSTLADFIARLPFERSADSAEDCRRKWRGEWAQLPMPNAAPSWKRWLDPVRPARVLARVLWDLKVGPDLERERSSAPAVLSLSVVRDLADSHWAPNRQLKLFESRAVLVDSRGEVLAEVPSLDPEMFQALERGADQLRSLTAQRLIRHLVRQAYELHKATPGRADVIVEGGFTGLAHALGERSKKAPEMVRDVLRAGQAFRRSWGRSREMAGLWTYTHEDNEARGRRAQLVITVGTMLRPYFAHLNLPSGQRFGIPLLPLPPFTGARRNEWPAQGVLQFLVLARFVERRLELVNDGGVRLTAGDWELLARRAGLRVDWRKVVDRWTQDGDDGPRMLERVGADRFHVSSHEPWAVGRRWIIEGAKVSEKGRARRAGKGRKRGE